MKTRWLSEVPPGVSAACLALLALALRVLNVRHGLPDFGEEAIPFKQAFEMWGWDAGRTDLNPHFFNYPSLSIYLHFVVQKLHCSLGQLTGQFSCPADYWLQYHIDPTAHVVIARLVGILADVATTLAAFALGERLRRGCGFLAAVLVALSPTIIETGNSIYCDSVMAALGLWALERLLAWQHNGGRGRLISAVVLIGLAAGAKYTAGLLVLPLAWVLWQRERRRALYLWPLAAAGCLLVFLLSSPYIAFDFSAFWRDFNFERGHMAAGHLGTVGRRAGLFQLTTLADNLGWPACLFLAMSLLSILGRRYGRRWPSILTLWLFLLPAMLSVAMFRMEAARYLLPILPVAAVVVADFGLAQAARWRARRRLMVLVVVCLVLVGPILRPGLLAARRGADTTQLQARRWLEAGVGQDEIIVQESYGAGLHNHFAINKIERSPAFQLAGEDLRARFRSLPVFRSVLLPMAVSGKLEVKAVPRIGSPVVLTVFEHLSELNQIFYEPALFQGVDYLVITGAVRGRYETDPDRYPVQNRFYEQLDRDARKVADFRPSQRVTGPTVSIYHLTGAAFLHESGPLDPLWWAEAVPRSFRLRLEELAIPQAERSAGARRRQNGEAAVWISSLRRPFDKYIRSFLYPMTRHFIDVRRFAHGEQFAAAILLVEPGELPAARYFSLCATSRNKWDEARHAVSAALETVSDMSPRSVPLRFEYARILDHAGEFAQVVEQMDWILAVVKAGSAHARRAQDFRRRAGSRADGAHQAEGGSTSK